MTFEPVESASKLKFYKTARVIADTAVFKAGQYVSVRYMGRILGIARFDCSTRAGINHQPVRQVMEISNLSNLCL